MEDETSPFTRLPAELVHHIVNFAAAASRRTCVNLCLVSSWARDIAIPHLLHTVVITNHQSNTKLRKYLRDSPHKSPGPGFCTASCVRNLWMASVSDGIISHFDACHNMENLALTDGVFLWLLHASSPTMLADRFNHSLSPRTLARDQELHLTLISAGTQWTHRRYISDDVTKRSPLLSKVTRLRLAASAQPPTNSDVCHFTNLTHLAVPYISGWEGYSESLRGLLDLESLKMLVVDIPKGYPAERGLKLLEDFVASTRKYDSRIYLVESPSRGFDILPQWEYDMRTGNSIWDRAVHYTDAFEVGRSGTA